MSVIVVKEQVATLVVAQSLAGGGGGAVASVNGRTGVVVLDAADVGAEPAGSLAAHVAASDPHTQYQREDALRQIIRVSTRPEATDVRTGLGVYDDTRPFASVQAALTASSVGDTIVVEPGEYSMGATTLTHFSGRVLDLRDAVLSWSGTSAPAVQVGDGQTLTIVGTGSLRLASSSFATVHALPGSTLHLRLREIRHLGNGAALIADGDTSLVADVVSSASYDALIFMGGRLHARIGRLGESGGSNAVAWEGVGTDATAFIDADEIIGDEVFAEEPDGASGSIWICAKRVYGQALGDGVVGTDSIRRWYLRADTLSLTDPDLSFVGPYFTIIDEQWERVSRRNAANGYAGLDAASKIAGSQQRYGTTADTACEGNDARLSDARVPTGGAGGDLTGTYPSPTLVSTGVVAGTYGSSTQIPVLTIDAKGRVTEASLTGGITPSAHASSHQHGGSDQIATATPGANAIPKADGSGRLDAWISDASTSAKGLVRLAASGGTESDRAVTGSDARLLNAWLRNFGPRPGLREFHVRARNTVNTLLRVGTGSGPALSGTISNSTLDGSGILQTWTTAASAGAVAGNLLFDSEANTRRSLRPRFVARVQASDSTTDVRQFIGLSDTQLGASDAPNCQACYFRHSTAAGDAGWVCVTNNATSRTVSGSVRTYTASETLVFGIDFPDDSTARFWLGTSDENMEIVHTETSTLPASGSNITACVGVGAVVAAARALRFGHASIWTV